MTKAKSTKGTAAAASGTKAEDSGAATSDTALDSRVPIAQSKAILAPDALGDEGGKQLDAAGEESATDLAASHTTAARPDVHAKRTYLVGAVPVRHNGRVYGVGYAIELTDAEAERLSGLLTPINE